MTCLLVIAGTDSSGGAGLTRDTAVAQDLGLWIKPIITSVTAQSDCALHEIYPIPPATITAQIAAAFQTNSPNAVKIGMLGSSVAAEAVTKVLAQYDIPIVVDPVLKTSSGSALFSGPFPNKLFRKTDVLTPNLHEASILTNTPVAQCLNSVVEQAKLCRQITGAQSVLIKGGHSDHSQCTDILCDSDGIHQFSSLRIQIEKRGTGCTLATAIACFRAKGFTAHDACHEAKKYVTNWINS
ncbi:hydroxymethylpyrimidine/phosphomethylpyrimidine kinase [uncultured Roseovarius sp.]|uniref:bifunctional hydroxymethylpyrimidine kinase/phosphomethylpyrimidine kinase n=1 Tax=uncultured Roseovarius sp. TaxID=293344 RepID=UPI00260BE0D2|nr:hydroxymethylpyrimidine/phosphomethylpyrimidine kinase [uncultured Roseovarius sp.]